MVIINATPIVVSAHEMKDKLFDLMTSGDCTKGAVLMRIEGAKTLDSATDAPINGNASWLKPFRGNVPYVKIVQQSLPADEWCQQIEETCLGETVNDRLAAKKERRGRPPKGMQKIVPKDSKDPTEYPKMMEGSAAWELVRNGAGGHYITGVSDSLGEFAPGLSIPGKSSQGNLMTDPSFWTSGAKRLTPGGDPRSGCPGVDSCFTYLGNAGTYFGSHTEDAALPSMNYCWGSEDNEPSKQWILIPGIPDQSKLEAFGHARHNCHNIFWRNKNALPTEALLNRFDITAYRFTQRPGDLLVTFPEGMHFGRNLTANVHEAVNVLWKEEVSLVRLLGNKQRADLKRCCEDCRPQSVMSIEFWNMAGQQAPIMELVPAGQQQPGMELVPAGQQQPGQQQPGMELVPAGQQQPGQQQPGQLVPAAPRRGPGRPRGSRARGAVRGVYQERWAGQLDRSTAGRAPKKVAKVAKMTAKCPGVGQVIIETPVVPEEHQPEQQRGPAYDQQPGPAFQQQQVPGPAYHQPDPAYAYAPPAPPPPQQPGQAYHQQQPGQAYPQQQVLGPAYHHPGPAYAYAPPAPLRGRPLPITPNPTRPARTTGGDSPPNTD